MAASVIAAAAVVIAVGVVLALRDQDGTTARRPVAARLRIEALPTLSLQATDYTTVAGVNEIRFVGRGGTETLRFDDPTLASFRVSNRGGSDLGRVELRAGRSYGIRSVIPGHVTAGVHAVIHVLPAGAPGSLPLPRAVLDEVGRESRAVSGPAHGVAQYAIANRDAANLVLSGDGVVGKSPVYAFVLHGHFVDEHASRFGDGNPPPTGTTLTFTLSQDPVPQLLDFGISSSDPDLSALGGVMTTRY